MKTKDIAWQIARLKSLDRTAALLIHHIQQQNMQIFQIEFASPEYDEAVRLRYEVLRRPLGLAYTPEQLAAEYADIHLVAADATGRIIGYLCLTPLDDTSLKMRQVAVHPDLQGRGVGRRLVEASEMLALQLGHHKMTLHARETAVPFYLNLDYHTIGERFEEVGIPHYKMEKQIFSGKQVGNG